MTINGLRRWLPAAAAVAVLPVTAAYAAPRMQSGYHVPYSMSAVTQVVQRGDRSGAVSPWAYDAFTRKAWVTFRGSAPLIYCGTSVGLCYAYTASFYDHGTFMTVAGSQSPNQGAHSGVLISRQVQGSFHGYGMFMTFFATTRPQAGLVPSTVSGDVHSNYRWPELFFPPSTTFAGVYESDYGSYYVAPQQRWVNTSFDGYGQLAVDGNITG